METGKLCTWQTRHCDVSQYTSTVHDYDYEYSAYEYEYEYRVLHLCQIHYSNYITNTTLLITMKIYTELFSSPQESEQKYVSLH